MRARALTLTLLLASALPVWADMDMAGMQGMNHGQAMAGTQNAPLSEGVIRKVYLAEGKVTIRHGELANLGMPAMTMTFSVDDKSLLNGYKVGDLVRFRAEQSAGGGLKVARIAHLR